MKKLNIRNIFIKYPFLKDFGMRDVLLIDGVVSYNSDYEIDLSLYDITESDVIEAGQEIDKYANVSIAELTKSAKQLTKRIDRLLKSGYGEMSYNGTRSTRKSTANHAAWMFSNQLQEIEAAIKKGCVQPNCQGILDSSY